MNIQMAKQIIEAAALADDTVIMQSLHGVGKSSIVEQFAKENDYYCMPLFLSHQEVGDLIGIPKIIEVGKESVTSWSKPTWLQRMIDYAWPEEVLEESDIVFSSKELEEEIKAVCTDVRNRDQLNRAYTIVKGLPNGFLHLTSNQADITNNKSRRSVLFLDELNRAPIDVRQSALQLVLEKKIHEHQLPCVNGEASIIVAAINPADTYQVDELDPALLDRFLFIEVEADAQSWLDWARSSNINPIVRDFIAENKQKLHFTPNNGEIGASPRSWAKLASFVDKMDKIAPELHHPIMKGKIGSALASQFLTFYNNYSKNISIKDIEKAITKAKKKNSDLESVGKEVAKVMKDQEVIQKTEMAQNFLEAYKTKQKADAAYPLLAYLYSLPLELRASFLKALKESEGTLYAKVAKWDGELNNGTKKLFLSIVNVVTKDA